jgi:glycosyltransferase involved in cell wall biosynthesis
MKTRESPRISVVMSIYNGETYLLETIESIFSQSFTDFELIVVNDGSTDTTLALLQNIAQQDKRLLIVTNETNRGFSYSLNKALGMARGKYVARMDADDLCRPDRFQIQHDFLESRPDIFLVGSWAINIDEKGKKLSLFKPPCDPDEIRRTMERYNCIFHISIMFRNTKQLFYREKMLFTEDNDFYLRCLTQDKRLANIPQFLVKYRRIPTSVSFSRRWLQMLFSNRAREFYHQRLESGADEYESFDPNDFLRKNPDEITDKQILREDINALFAVGNMTEARKRARQFMKHHGFVSNPKVLAYYLASFMNKKVLNGTRRTILRMKGKY